MVTQETLETSLGIKENPQPVGFFCFVFSAHELLQTVRAGERFNKY